MHFYNRRKANSASNPKQAPRRITATLVAAGLLAPIAFATASPAQAQVGPNPHTDVIIAKAFDGTGHGTSDASYVNTENGYVPGDDTADDNIVSSNDLVGYDVTVLVKAGPARTVSLDMTGTKMLDWKVGQDAFCAPAPGITAEVVQNSCQLTIKQGATAQLTRQVQMTAADTRGLVMDGERLDIAVSVAGGATYSTTQSDPVTVVSAPKADLVVRGGSLYSNASAGTGSFTLEARALQPTNYSATKGVSTGGEWQATADVSAFPDGTTWKLGTSELTPTDGKLQLAASGNQTLQFTMPNSKWPEQDEGTTAQYDLSLAVPDTAFSTEDYLNNGDGWQPGTGISRDKSTYDAITGAVRGYHYPNNDYSAIRVDRPILVQGQIFSKSVEVPFTPSDTLFDAGNILFEHASTTEKSYPSHPRSRAAGTEFLAHLDLLADNIATGGVAVFADVWDSSQSAARGPVTLLSGSGEALTPAQYEVQWSAEGVSGAAASKPGETAGWISNADPIPGANTVRVIVPDGNITPGSGTWRVTVPMQVNSDYPVTQDPIVRDTHQGRIGDVSGAVPGALQVIQPTVPELGITQSVDAEVAAPGNVLNYTVTPTVKNPATLQHGFDSTITVELDRCETDPVSASDAWVMTASEPIPGPSGRVCGDAESTPSVLTFTPSEGETVTHAEWNPSKQIATLPQITYSARAILSAKNSVATTAVHALAGAGDVVQVSANSQTSMLEQHVSAAFIESLQDKVEVQDPMSWNIELVQQVSSGTSETVIALPSDSDGRHWNADLDPDDLYPGDKQSSFTGSYTLASVSLNGEDTSAGVELWFTTAARPSLDAAVGTWHEVSQAGTGNIPALAGATALKVSAPALEEGATTTRVTVKLKPAGNAQDDVYVMWVGGTLLTGDGAGATMPWPAQSAVVAGEISGTVWWDENRSSTMQASEDRIDGVELGLFPVVDGAVADTPVAITTTSRDGDYRFDDLRSGQYQVQVIARGDNLPESVTSYYAEDVLTETTFSFKGQRFARSSMKSTEIKIRVGGVQKNVDFGFFAPDPKVDVDKQPGHIKCDGGMCDVTWNITLTNLGNTDITGGTFADTASDSLYDVEALFGEFLPGVEVVEVVERTSVGAYALTATGDVYSWGYGSYGANGNGSMDSNFTAELVQGLPAGQVAKVIARGGSGGYALTTSGDVYAWGVGSRGANGNGSNEHNLTAKPVQGLPAGQVAEIMTLNASSNGGYALTHSGDLYAWGSGRAGGTGNGGTADNLTAQPVQGLPAGQVAKVIPSTDINTERGFALTTGGDVFSWGHGGKGANGNGSNKINYIAEQVQGLPAGQTAEVIFRPNGGYAITTSGVVYSWGDGENGANGNGIEASYPAQNLTAQPVLGLPGGQVVQVVARYTYGGIAVTSSGDVYSWGSGGDAGVGSGNGNGGEHSNLTAQLVQGLPAGQMVEVGDRSGFGGYAISRTGEVYSWGSGFHGDGNGEYHALTAVKVQGLPAVQTGDVIMRGSSGGYAFVDGNAYSWGHGRWGANGNGSDRENYTAKLVVGMPDGQVVELRNHGYALTSDGTVYSWGIGGGGANGNGGPANNLSAEPVLGMPGPELNASSAATPLTANAAGGGLTERRYAVPLIPAGEEVSIVVRGKVNRANKPNVVLNQAWFTSPTTPIAGLLPDGQVRPDLPISPGSDLNPEGIPGNPTCNTDVDRGGQKVADSCDQVPLLIPFVLPDMKPGQVSGVAWLDVNWDGTRDGGEPLLPGITANLFQDGKLRGTTLTGADGAYLFDTVPPGREYTVTFDLAGTAPTPEQLALFGLETGSFGLTTEGDRGEFTSWTNLETFTTGEVNVSVGGYEEWLNIGAVLANAGIEVTKSSAAGDPAALPVDENGMTESVAVDLTFTNTGSEPLHQFTWVDETLEGPAIVDLICGADESLVLHPGETVACTATLPALLLAETPAHTDRFTVNATGTITGTPVQDSDEWSAVAAGEPSWSLSKTSDPESGKYVGASSEITYTVEAINTGDLTLRGLVAYDDMKDVLKHADLVGDLPAGVQRTGDTLVWAIPDIAPGMSASIQYTVKIHDDAWGQTLINKVTAAGDLPPTSCTVNDPCKTEHHTPPWPGALPLPVLGNVAFIAFLIIGGVALAAGGVIAVQRRRERKVAAR